MAPDFLWVWPIDLLEGSADLDLDTARTGGTEKERRVLFLDDVIPEKSSDFLVSLKYTKYRLSHSALILPPVKNTEKKGLMYQWVNDKKIKMHCIEIV